MTGDPTTEWKVMRTLIPATRQRLLAMTGVRLPWVQIKDNPQFTESSFFSLLLKDVLIISGKTQLGKWYVPPTPNNLQALGIQGEAVIDPASLDKAHWVDPSQKSLLEANQLAYWLDPYDYIMAVVEEMLVHSLDRLIDPSFCRTYLQDYVNQNNTEEEKDLARAIQSDPFLYTSFTSILKELVRERLPLHNKKAIIESFTKAAADHLYTNEWLQPVRWAIRNEWPAQLLQLVRVSLPPATEALVKQSLVTANGKTWLSIAPETYSLVVEAIAAVTGNFSEQKKKMLVVTESRLRIYVKKLTAFEFPYLTVMAKEELENK